MAPRRKQKEKAPWWQFELSGVEVAVLVLAMLAVLRCCDVPVPFVDDAIARIKLVLHPPEVPPEAGSDVAATMAAAWAGQPMVFDDLLFQLRHYCAEGGGGSCTEWLEAVPLVAAAVRRGPGTWDRKPLKKAKTLELDRLLASVNSRSDASAKVRQALRAIGEELLDVAPKSIKKDLLAWDSPGAAKEDEVEVEL
ncbi:unnamed protein product [Polarella glacialis]|uniref:Uncharacterized protein n=1 Tax=Polarella glacialis TaxID=89957 RepID=A0A813KYP3_POLGL|nr:unnamed protein product [Polarella glacialis]|mmetsp:Transcript_35014/g.63104  ORF Transcript_35014/g.63104 Transcript_35014/m.63104 type:complete len:195 (-) Transcript_35014:49-633(-)